MNRIFNDGISKDQALLRGYFNCPHCTKRMFLNQGDYCPHCNRRVSRTV